MATIKLFGNLRKYGKDSHIQIPGASVRAVVETLCAGDPNLCDVLLEDGVIRPYFKITLNGRDIALAEGLDTFVREDDQIAIFPPIAGG